jgi:hypothetical protein
MQNLGMLLSQLLQLFMSKVFRPLVSQAHQQEQHKPHWLL